MLYRPVTLAADVTTYRSIIVAKWLKHCKLLPKQSGATAVEFAIIFPVFFLIIYCGIAFAYVFILQQAITFAADEGAQAAVAVDPTLYADDPGAYQNAVQQRAVSVVSSSLSWLPAQQLALVAGNVNAQAAPCPFSSTTDAAGNLYYICIQFPVVASGLFPEITLPLTGGAAFPPLPPVISAQGVVRLS